MTSGVAAPAKTPSFFSNLTCNVTSGLKSLSDTVSSYAKIAQGYVSDATSMFNNVRSIVSSNINSVTSLVGTVGRFTKALKNPSQILSNSTAFVGSISGAMSAATTARGVLSNDIVT